MLTLPVKLKNHLILLDIDGTITADGDDIISKGIFKKIQILKRANVIYLCSNRRPHARNQKLARDLGVHYLRTELRKPNPFIKKFIKNPQKLPLIVIGDKWLTDGFFARNIKAKFIKINRIVSGHESFLIKISYWLDDILWLAKKLIKLA
ncbi:MAG: hypothetical protein UT55_C0040G0005 [Candidatus Peregrinibacteria bacterium GW2011_GWE2_39_6]|nr:MAG: hypothetical protein UT36_C0003G0069 [Candidatus Peregrinibacteria bacterium GW2011_GWF2_39_17]KKR25521.1 MAG: hypothetical protein UT55_C0040G0005 [Candidatus Peregrinibacteria bacterium GW2011_GWE2_39_6]HCW31969.1 hypothetical protein [Candidatus Peregrinibacteria bacterium]